MPHVLTEDQIAQYHKEGYVFPFDAIEADDLAEVKEAMDRFEADQGASVGSMHFKGHLCLQWSERVTRHPAILDAVEDLIGPNLMVFASRYWIKQGGDDSYVSWHQDAAYFGLDPHECVTVWLALTDASIEAGCMRVMPGSHEWGPQSHNETFNEKNLLARGQVIEGLDDDKGVFMPLKAGQFSLHQERLIHGSPPNMTNNPRVGLALFYIPTHVRSTIGRRTATLVRGIDEFGHWDPDPLPEQDGDPRVLAHIGAAHTRYTDPEVDQEASTAAE